MDKLVKTDPMYSLLGIVGAAVIGTILMIFIIPPALGVFGRYSCTGCDPLVVAFGILFLPVAAVFIILYKIWYSFAVRS